MKNITRIALLTLTLFAFCFLMSCEETEECTNYDIVDGGMSLNGSLLFPAVGTSVNTSTVFENKMVTWFGRGVEEDCVLNNTVTLIVNLGLNDDITGSFNFDDNEMGGQISYGLDENGENGETRSIVEGTLVIESEGEGVLTLDFDGFDSDGAYIDFEVRHEFL